MEPSDLHLKPTKAPDLHTDLRRHARLPLQRGEKDPWGHFSALGPLTLVSATMRAQDVHPCLRQEQQMDKRGRYDGQKGGAGDGWGHICIHDLGCQ